MIFAIWAFFCLFGNAMLFRIWYKGEGFQYEENTFSLFVGLALLEGFAMVTTILPPTSGVFAGALFGIWVWRHILAAVATLREKFVSNNHVGLSALFNITFFALVSASYLG